MTRGRLLGLGCAALVALAAVGLFLLPLDWGDSRVQQAAIAAGVVAIGWLAAFLLRETSAHLARAERLRDVHRALYAEIAHNLGNLGTPEALQEFGEEMLDRITDADGFVPFVPRERNDAVFRTVLPEIHLLPRTSIDPVVQYYSQLGALDALIEDMRGETFRTMAPRRRSDLYADYIAIKIRLVRYGEEALAVIDAYAKGGRRKAHAVSNRFAASRPPAPSRGQ